MDFLNFILLLILFLFFGIASIKGFRAMSKRFLVETLTVLLAVVALYLLTHIYKEPHPSVFIFWLFLIIGAGVFFCTKILGR